MTVQKGRITDAESGAVLALARMERGIAVVVEPQDDPDPKKSRNLRHKRKLGPSRRQSKKLSEVVGMAEARLLTNRGLVRPQRRLFPLR